MRWLVTSIPATEERTSKSETIRVMTVSRRLEIDVLFLTGSSALSNRDRIHDRRYDQTYPSPTRNLTRSFTTANPFLCATVSKTAASYTTVPQPENNLQSQFLTPSRTNHTHPSITRGRKRSHSSAYSDRRQGANNHPWEKLEQKSHAHLSKRCRQHFNIQ